MMNGMLYIVAFSPTPSFASCVWISEQTICYICNNGLTNNTAMLWLKVSTSDTVRHLISCTGIMCTPGCVCSTNGRVNSLLPKHSKPSIRNCEKKAVQMHLKLVEISAKFFWFQLSCTCTCMLYLVSLHMSRVLALRNVIKLHLR